MWDFYFSPDRRVIHHASLFLFQTSRQTTVLLPNNIETPLVRLSGQTLVAIMFEVPNAKR
jgi:hypothetical protein